MVRVADIIWAEIARQGVRHAFILSGGGAMYLVDALGKSQVEYICCHHEQSCSIAAQAYAMKTNGLGVSLVTTGPGGTNALTGCAAAYMDSTPVLFLSGQVKTEDRASIRNVRQFGAQENDIVAMAAPVTKYSVLVEKAEDVLYELQKAIFIATNGRRGPVWIDIPLDVQAAMVNEETLLRFDSERETIADPTIAVQHHPDEHRLNQSVDDLLAKLASSRRPLVLIGHGLVASGAEKRFRQITAKTALPTIATWRALGVLDRKDPLFFGSPGLQATRSANMITQGADLLLVLGSRLDNMITAFAEQRFAIRAQKIIVDIDVNEMNKFTMPELTTINCDIGYFLDRLLTKMPDKPTGEIGAWRDFCVRMTSRYPLLAEKQSAPLEFVDLYHLVDAVSSACDADDTIVVSSTSRCNTAGHLAFHYQKGQTPISSMGFGAMGFAVPSALGAWFASGKKRVILFEGDGSFQLNLQELQTIRHYSINAKIFVFSNNGYAAIATMQDRNFAGFRIGSDCSSGVTMPALEGIAKAYGFPFIRIRSNDEIAHGVRMAMEVEGPVLCEVLGDLHFDEIPKCISSVDEHGRRFSAALENPYPFLPDNEIAAIYAQLS